MTIIIIKQNIKEPRLHGERFCRRDYFRDLDWVIILAYLDGPETITVMIIRARVKGGRASPGSQH